MDENTGDSSPPLHTSASRLPVPPSTSASARQLFDDFVVGGETARRKKGEEDPSSHSAPSMSSNPSIAAHSPTPQPSSSSSPVPKPSSTTIIPKTENSSSSQAGQPQQPVPSSRKRPIQPAQLPQRSYFLPTSSSAALHPQSPQHQFPSYPPPQQTHGPPAQDYFGGGLDEIFAPGEYLHQQHQSSFMDQQHQPYFNFSSYPHLQFGAEQHPQQQQPFMLHAPPPPFGQGVMMSAGGDGWDLPLAEGGMLSDPNLTNALARLSHQHQHQNRYPSQQQQQPLPPFGGVGGYGGLMDPSLAGGRPLEWTQQQQQQQHQPNLHFWQMSQAPVSSSSSMESSRPPKSRRDEDDDEHQIKKTKLVISPIAGENRLKIQFLDYGTPGRVPQHFGTKGYLIPDGLSGTHKVYHQTWQFSIAHRSQQDTIVITWTIINLTSNTAISRTETPREARLRETSGHTLCNQLLRTALKARAAELEDSLAQIQDNPTKVANTQSLIKVLNPKSCILGLLFFGLLHETVQERMAQILDAEAGGGMQKHYSPSN